MGDPWADYYSGAMAPPMRLPGGTLAPAPNAVPALTVDQMYEGIFGPQNKAQGLATRTVQALPVTASNWSNPNIAPSRQPSQQQLQAIRNVPSMSPPNEARVPALPAFGNGTQMGYAPQDSYRLLPNPGMPSLARDTPVVAAIASASQAPAYRNPGHMAVTFPPEPVHVLNPAQDRSAQQIADDLKIPVKKSDGSIVRPRGGTQLPAAAYAATQQPKAQHGGLLGLLLGGNGAGQQGAGLGAVLGNLLTQHPITTPAYNPNWATQANSGSPFWATEGNSNGYSSGKGGALV